MNRPFSSHFILIPALVLSLTLPGPAQPLKLRLPTDNRALLESQPENFYMFVYRTFEGETSKPW